MLYISKSWPSFWFGWWFSRVLWESIKITKLKRCHHFLFYSKWHDHIVFMRLINKSTKQIKPRGSFLFSVLWGGVGKLISIWQLVSKLVNKTIYIYRSITIVYFTANAFKIIKVKRNAKLVMPPLLSCLWHPSKCTIIRIVIPPRRVCSDLLYCSGLPNYFHQ
jgi:hypothetical protein